MFIAMDLKSQKPQFGGAALPLSDSDQLFPLFRTEKIDDWCSKL
jgi:hypothetical protein